MAYAREAANRGLGVIIAGAGGAAHLAGVIAAATTLPVIGVPIALAKLDGLDSLLSMVQMPRGIPVATVAIDGARNAGLLAGRILGLGDERVRSALVAHAERLADDVRARDRALQERLGST
jgi:5-(carboxyamino)imidazole ribonucleotide mutase